MQYTDLLDIKDIFIYVRFKLKLQESFCMIKDLEEWLWLNLKRDNHSTDVLCERVKEYILKYNNSIDYTFGMDDDYYEQYSSILIETSVLLDFFIIVHTIKEKLIEQDYDAAFKILDDVHNFPTDILEDKEKGINALKKYSSNLIDRKRSYYERICKIIAVGTKIIILVLLVMLVIRACNY